MQMVFRKLGCTAEAYTQFGIVLVVPTLTPTVPLVKRLRVTSSSGLLYECLRNLVFEGAGSEYFSLADGLLGAINIFRELASLQDMRPGQHEKYCVIISNRPHHSLPYNRGSEFDGSSVTDIISNMKKQQIKLSIVSPRRIPELKSLYEQALLTAEYSMDSNKQYKHLVMLQGIDLQGDPMNILIPDDQTQIQPNDLTYSPIVPTPNHSYIPPHPVNPNSVSMIDAHNTQIYQHNNNQNQQILQTQSQMSHNPQQTYQSSYSTQNPQQQFHEQQTAQQLSQHQSQQQHLQQQQPQQTQQQQPQTQQSQQQLLQTQQPQSQQQQTQHTYQQIPSPPHQKLSPKTSPNVTNLNISSPNNANPSLNEPKEPPQKKQCVDDSSNSPSAVPPIDIPSDLPDIKPTMNSLNTYFTPNQQQHIPDKDVTSVIEDFKPQISNLGITPQSNIDPALKSAYQMPPSQHVMPSQPIDITLEEGRPHVGGNFCQVKGRVTFQHQSLIPDGFPKRWTFKTSPPIVYLREILFAQGDPSQYGNSGIHDRGLIHGTMQILDNPNLLPCLHNLTENKMCLFLYHHRVHQTTNFQINFQMLIVKLNELANKSTLTVLYPIDKRFYQRFSEVMKKGQMHVTIQQQQKVNIPRMPPHNVLGMMQRGPHQHGMGLDQIASNQMAQLNQMQGSMGGNMGMSGMNQMGNIPQGYSNDSMMGGNMGVQSNNTMVGNGSNSGQGNGTKVSLSTSVADMSGVSGVSNMSNHMGGNSNPMMNNLPPNMGVMGANMINNPSYTQTGNQVSMSTRNQTGDQTQYATQGGGVPSGGDKHVLSLLLKSDKPSARPQLGINRPLRLPSQQGMINQMPVNRMMQQQPRYPPQVRRPMMPNQPMLMGGRSMMSGMDSSMMMGMGSQTGMGQMGSDRMQGMPGMVPLQQGGMIPNPAMQKQNQNQMHYMKN
ncbi:hypothetical protein LOD99_5111 [Oopsacas minuta]|uniref:Mediator of RNA polymerase II transcription subunit 25 von Willebrand factor type A domain-containing protein n=1 Tax=Oopsacas minuta TaxID=111878 RepID=A0AAV7JS18_9METZ|nr:hypothetical protein LOD99_5111 [Oopsacas minuta]